jgi:hypothetical protein
MRMRIVLVLYATIRTELYLCVCVYVSMRFCVFFICKVLGSARLKLHSNRMDLDSTGR